MDGGCCCWVFFVGGVEVLASGVFVDEENEKTVSFNESLVNAPASF